MAPLLDDIDGPEDLKPLDEDELQQVAQEVRDYIIDTVGEIGGHFGANLGTCELAVALHSVLDSPRDKILWDVGHQAYPHKVLTGRRDELPTIRKYGGLAPFCSREESRARHHGRGPRVDRRELRGRHQGGDAALGSDSAEGRLDSEQVSRTAKPSGEQIVVAVVGDGAMTGGVNFEALLNAGGLETPVVIVLNDNGMSISPNVGALSRYFNRLRLNPRGWQAREAVEAGLTRLPAGIGGRIERLGPQLKESIKAFWAPGLFFEELDLAYVGVIDGHDVKALRRALTQALGARPPRGRAHQDGEGQGLRPGRGGRPRGHGEVACRKAGERREGGRLAGGEARRGCGFRAGKGSAAVHGGLRPGAGRGGAPRPARDRHHGRDGGRHRTVAPRPRAARSVLRRRHRRAARGAVRGRPRARGHEARVRDLLHLPAARATTRSSTTSACSA